VEAAVRQAWEIVDRQDGNKIELAARELADALVLASKGDDQEGITREPYSVLIAEDDETQLEQVRRSLSPYFYEVKGFAYRKKALEVLKSRAAEGRPFDAVVADWDLREGGITNGLMQPIQGFELL